MLASVDLSKFIATTPISDLANKLWLDLVILAENALGEYWFSERVSRAYAEKFKDLAHQVVLKEEVLKHYQRKLEMALSPNIHSEEELVECMYKQLVNEKLNSGPGARKVPVTETPGSADGSSLMDWMKENIKFMYRSISKSCAEIHSLADGEIRFPELHEAFLEANSIYIESGEDLADVVLQHARLIALFARVILYRKINGFDLNANLQPIVGRMGNKPVIGAEELKNLRIEMEIKVAATKIRNYTSYKMNFVMFDDLTEIHSHYLRKHLDYIDQQILRIQADIQSILWQKENMPAPCRPFNPEDLL